MSQWLQIHEFAAKFVKRHIFLFSDGRAQEKTRCRELGKYKTLNTIKSTYFLLQHPKLSCQHLHLIEQVVQAFAILILAIWQILGVRCRCRFCWCRSAAWSRYLLTNNHAEKETLKGMIGKSESTFLLLQVLLCAIWACFFPHCPWTCKSKVELGNSLQVPNKPMLNSRYY